MTHTLLDKKVNINEYPQVDKEHLAANGNQITLGDLHASALKLLWTLIRHGFIKLSQEDYQQFVELYYNEASLSNKEVVSGIRAIIERAQVNPAAKNANLMLIGDILADRGKNDLYTLLLLKKLRDNHIPVEILISNHDAEFIKLYESNLGFHLSQLGGQAASATNLQQLIAEGVVDRSEITELVESSYKPYLKALSYTLDTEKNEITIYSHGLIDLNNIKNMAEKLGTPFFGVEPAQLAKTIDQINIEFDKYVKANKVSDLIELDKLSLNEINYSLIDPKKYPLAHLIWNRNADQLNRNVDNVFFVHGHDSKNPSAGKVYNVDNILSKLPLREFGEGINNVLFTPAPSLALSLKHPVKIDKEDEIRLPQLDDDIDNEWVNISTEEEEEEKDLTRSIIFDNTPPAPTTQSGYVSSLFNRLWSRPVETKQVEPIVTSNPSTEVLPTYKSLAGLGMGYFDKHGQRLTGTVDLTQSMVLSPVKEEKDTYESLAPEGMVYVGKHGEPLTGELDLCKSMILIKKEKPKTTYESLAEEGMVYTDKHGRPLTGSFDLNKSYRYIPHKEKEAALGSELGPSSRNTKQSFG